VLAVVFVLCATIGPTWSQAGLGSIRGQVTDPSGRSIPDAAVSLINEQNSTRTAKTDLQGQYQLRNISQGTYTVRVSAKGFAPAEKSGVEIASGSPQVLDFPMTLAPTAEKVTVQDNVQVEVDPSSNASALVLRGKELDALSDDRDDLAADLALLAGPAAGPNGGQIYVDGFTGGRLPAKSSIREIRINQNPFSAQYDRIGMGEWKCSRSRAAKISTANFKLMTAATFRMPEIRSPR
jgi:hypothetical protein